MQIQTSKRSVFIAFVVQNSIVFHATSSELVIDKLYTSFLNFYLYTSINNSNASALNSYQFYQMERTLNFPFQVAIMLQNCVVKQP